MSEEMKAVFEALLPPGAIWNPKPDGDFDRLLSGMGDNAQIVYEYLADLAHIRDPYTTTILSDLEKEYGILTNLVLTEEERRQQLAAQKYSKPNTASDDLLQDRLRAAGFDGIIVTANDPAIQPDIISGEYLVNGPAYLFQDPGYLAEANGDNMFAGNSRAVAGYFVNIIRTEKDYDLNPYWTSFRDKWRFVFFVGGAASGWPSTPAIATYDIDWKKEEQLKRIILAYKPLHSWAKLVVDYVMFWTAQTADASYTGTFYAGCFGDDIYILGGSNGEIQTSPDTINWTHRTADGSYTGTFRAGAFGDGVHILVGDNGEIQRSTDGGLTWNTISPDGGYTGTFRAATWGNDTFVIAGDNGEIQISTDGGLTWSAQSADGGYTGNFKAATFGNNLFVLAGQSAEIQIASDPTVWAAQSPAGAFTGDFEGASFGNNQYLLVGASAEIQRSYNGQLWIHEDPDPPFSTSFTGAMCGNGISVIIGDSAEIQRSFDNVIWKHEKPDGAFIGTFFATIIGNRKFVIGGINGEIQTSA